MIKRDFWSLSDLEKGPFFTKAKYLQGLGHMLEYNMMELAEILYDRDNKTQETEEKPRWW